MAELRSKKTTTEQPAAETARLDDWLSDPRFADSVARILPRHLTSERFVAVMARTVRAVPKLRECTPSSVLGAFIDAATLGLEIGVGGESWVIPYSVQGTMTAQLQVGYLGWLKLAWQSDRVASVDCNVVTRDEVETGRFSYQHGTDGFLHHRPIEGRELNEKTIAFAYAVVWVKGSDRPVWRVLDAVQIDRLRRTGRSANSPAWSNWFDEQSMAKALKRTLKWVPRSRELAAAVSLDDEADAGVPQSWGAAPDVAAFLGSPRAPSDFEAGMAAGSRGADTSSAAAGTEAGANEGDAGTTSSAPPPIPPVRDEREPQPVPARRSQRGDEPQGGGLGW